VPFYLTAARSAGFQATVLPAPLISSVSWNGDWSATDESLAWLDALAKAYELDSARLRAWFMSEEKTSGPKLHHDLLYHWTCIGNLDGVFLGRRSEEKLPGPDTFEPAQRDPRWLDKHLLACAPGGLIPICGFYPAEGEDQARVQWLQPQASFLMVGAESVEVRIAFPSPYFRREPIRLEIRLENEQLPQLVIMAQPGQSITCVVPIPKQLRGRESLLVQTNVNAGFIPNDYAPGPDGDTRLLAVQLLGAKSCK
jgi:hypothetical protein